MQKIGNGWQYEVFDLGNGRVLKVPHTFWKQYGVIRKSARGRWLVPCVLLYVLKARRLYESSLGALRRRTDVDWSLVGFPEFNDDGSYTQEKVKMLGEALKGRSVDERRELMHRYADLQRAMWRYGFGETVYNFKINAGIRADGRLVQVDLGELTFSKEKMRKRLASGRWKVFDSYRTADEALKRIVEEVFETTLTPEVLEQNWGRGGPAMR